MKGPYFTTVGLLVTLLHFSQEATAGGTLNFVTLYSAVTLSNEDDTNSSSISTDGGFPFGTGTIYSVYVSTNGDILMGETPCSSYSLSFPSSCSVVAPYAADINTQIAGSVRYTDFYTYSSFGSSMTTVSRFIRDETGDYFYGNRMMVAEWNGVAKYNGIFGITNTFQGILITDGTDSYAVFIYECGGMEWGGGVIGWQASSSNYMSHYLSGRSNSNDIGCLYSSSYSAVVFRLDTNCDSDEFTCDNGECEPQSHVCDGYDDCGDNSDEERCANCDSDDFTCDNGECKPQSHVCDQYDDCGDNSDEVGCAYSTIRSCSLYEFTCDNGECIYESDRCDHFSDCEDDSDEDGCAYSTTRSCSSYEFTCDNGECIYESDRCDHFSDCEDDSDEDGCVNVGLIVGITVGVLAFLIIFIGLPICVVAGVYCSARRSRTYRPVQTRVVATTPMAGATTVVTSSQAGTSTAAPAQYPLQPVYKDTQFSNQDTPPSYADVNAYQPAVQGFPHFQPTSAAAYPQQQSTSYPIQTQAYPQDVPYSNQGCPMPAQPIPQPDGSEGNSSNVGLFLQQ